jgi:hypothetical protein
MDEMDSKDALPSSFWTSPKLSWGLVFFGLVLFHFSQVPSLPEQIAQCNRGMNAQNLLVLGYLLGISTIPIFGLWRLSTPLGLPRILAFLYLGFPLAIVGVYLVKPFLDRVRFSR